jgi:hypothetical protein
MVTRVEDPHHESDRSHDPADEVCGPLLHQQGADHREGTEPYSKHYVLHQVFLWQPGAALKEETVQMPATYKGAISHPTMRLTSRARVLTPPTPRVDSPVPCVTTPLYKTTVSRALRGEVPRTIFARTSCPRGHGSGTEVVEVGDTWLLTSFSIDGEYTSDTL